MMIYRMISPERVARITASALDYIAQLPPDSPPAVVLLSDPIHAPEVWATGVRGILPREADGPSLRGALIAGAQGLVVLNPEASASLLPAADQVPAQPTGELTPRELEILQILAEGLPSKGIASQLSISEHTVKFHVNAIMGKLGAQSRTAISISGKVQAPLS